MVKVSHVAQISFGDSATHDSCSLGVSPDHSVFVVTQGFGGGVLNKAAASQGASNILDFMSRQVRDEEATFPFILRQYLSLAGNVLLNAILYANGMMLKTNRAKNVHEKSGSSSVAAIVDEGVLSAAQMGLGSCTVVRGGQWREITQAQSFQFRQNPFAELTHATQDLPMQALGIEEGVEPVMNEVRLQAGDWVILATHGVLNSLILQDLAQWNLTGTFDEAEIRSVFDQGRSHKSGKLLICLAN